MIEAYILKSIHRDIEKESTPPTSQQIENEYTKRVESKFEECGVFPNFLRKVKKFHGIIKNIQRWMAKKTSNLSCFGHGDIDQRQPPPLPNDAPSTRKLFIAALRETLYNMSTSVGNSHNNGQPVLRPDQIQDMAKQLDGLVGNEVDKKAEQTPMDSAQQLFEYVKMGNEVIDKLKNIDFFISTVKGYFEME